MEGFERNMSQFLHRWLGLSQSLRSIALYGHDAKLQLPFSSLVEEFKVTQARVVLLYQDSTDTKVFLVGID